MQLTVRPGSKVNRIGVSAASAIAEQQSPKSGYRDGVPVLVRHCPQRGAGSRIESVNGSVAEITHQQVIGEGAESSRRQRDAPGSVQRTARGDMLHQAAVQV